MVADFIRHRPIDHQIEARAESRQANTTVTLMNNIKSTEATRQSVPTDEAVMVAIELLIDDMEDNEKCALIIQALWSYDSTFNHQLLSIQPKSKLPEALQKAIDLIEDLSPRARITLAIDLLGKQEQEDYEEDEDED